LLAEDSEPENVFEVDPNYFVHYIKPFHPFDFKGQRPKHKYTIEIHRCKYTKELEDMSTKFETTIFKRTDYGEQFVRGFMCDNPLYNPENMEDANVPSYPDY
jgi:hypothetical protein